MLTCAQITQRISSRRKQAQLRQSVSIGGPSSSRKGLLTSTTQKAVLEMTRWPHSRLSSVNKTCVSIR
eukprot:COSAG01_NODE_2466_length_7642_cov_5.268991_6_plen_68_part_00